MKTKQHHFLNNAWTDHASDLNAEKCQLALVFGSPECIVQEKIHQYLVKTYPNANIVFSSTSGEIINDSVYDNSIAVTAIEFEKTRVGCVKTNISEHSNSFETGSYLIKQINESDLKCVFIISDGTLINGSDLVSGLNHDNYNKVPITGGLAGDDAKFEKTLIGLNDIPTQGNVVAIGFYGKDILIGHSSIGGWTEFGHERIITRSDKNTLYELDGKNALDLYKQYLGDYLKELPGSALLFPLSIRINGSDKNLVRTILNIDEENKTMTFAGNLPEGSKVRLMKGNFDKLIGAGSKAAENSLVNLNGHDAGLALLISCVGRKLILQDRTDEEVEAAKEVLGENTTITGFYSHGEISPFDTGSQCELHNQTMTITTFAEA
jgi:hypothetical protein